MDKCLVVGNGPSHTDYEFIRNFEGPILCCDITVRDLVNNDIIPDYMLFSETNETISNHIVEWMPSNLVEHKEKLKVVHRSKCRAIMVNRCGRLKLERIVYDADIYGNDNAINNVGLYSICFAGDILEIPEIHLIGLDYGGGDYPDVKQSWIDSTRHYYNNRVNTPNIIDHSGGNFPEFDQKYYTR